MKKNFELDVLGGIKLASIKIGASTDMLGIKMVSGARDRLWLDPLIAANRMYKP